MEKSIEYTLKYIKEQLKEEIERSKRLMEECARAGNWAGAFRREAYIEAYNIALNIVNSGRLE